MKATGTVSAQKAATRRLLDMKMPRINPVAMNFVHDYSNTFFKQRDFFYCHAVGLENIFGACEDPETMVEYRLGSADTGTEKVFPVIQSSQMELERFLMQGTPAYNKLWTMITSTRNEPEVEDGRHNWTFPLVECEGFGDFDDLVDILTNYYWGLGFRPREATEVPSFPLVKYQDACKRYGVTKMTNVEEEKLWHDYGDVVLLTHFPKEEMFFNMKTGEDGSALKIDVIACGKESAGSAVRETDGDLILKNFYESEEGGYSQALFNAFGKERVLKDLHTYVALPNLEKVRYGMGFGWIRIMAAMLQTGLIKPEDVFLPEEPTPNIPK